MMHVMSAKGAALLNSLDQAFHIRLPLDLCRTFGAQFSSTHLSRPYGRAYSMPAFRASEGFGPHLLRHAGQLFCHTQKLYSPCGFGLLYCRRDGGDYTGRRPLLIIGLAVTGVATAIVGVAPSMPLFLGGALVAGAATGVFTSPQQAAVADIIGSKARGGTAVATFQMMSDFGSIVGSYGVGQIAQHLSFGWAFALSGLILLVASVGWMFAPETRDAAPLEHTPARPLGPEAAGELP